MPLKYHKDNKALKSEIECYQLNKLTIKIARETWITNLDNNQNKIFRNGKYTDSYENHIKIKLLTYVNNRKELNILSVWLASAMFIKS